MVQDVLTYLLHASAGPARGIGTSLRFFDRRAGKWEVIWLGAVTGITVVLWGGPVGEEIWLEGPDPDGTLNRWMFTDVSADSFTW